MPKSMQEYLDELYRYAKRSKFEGQETMTAIPTVSNAQAVTGPTGELIMIITHSRGTYPVVGATITVRDNNNRVVQSTTTDQSGRSERIILPTLSKDLTDAPNNSNNAVALYYDAQIDAENYVSALIKNIPIFEGITSLQNYDMLYKGAVSNTDMQIIELPINNL